MEYARDFSAETDEELLSRSIEHPGLFEILVLRHQRAFLERALFVVKNRDDAEDIVQDTFVRIYRFASRFSGEAGTFKSWSLTILMNVARTRYQKKAKEWRRGAPLLQEHYEALAAPSEQGAQEARDIIKRALEHLPKSAARILHLASLEGLPYEEIAEREGISIGAVKTRVHRAKKILKETIGDIRV